MAQPFDEARLQLKGEPAPVVDRVALSGATGQFSVSPAGVLVFRPGAKNVTYQLTWFDSSGKLLNTFGQPGGDTFATLSPDGTHAVVRNGLSNAPGDLWTIDFTRGVRSRFTFRASPGDWGIWSSDGSRIAFSAGNGADTLYVKPATGGIEKELLHETGRVLLPDGWSQDGRLLLYSSSGGKTAADIWVLSLDGGHKPVPLLATEFSELESVFSPDTRWVAYTSNESGRYEIYVRPFIASGPSGAPALGEAKWQVSRDGGANPRWIAGGRQIVFEASGTGTMMAVDVKGNGAAFEASTPRKLFQPAQAVSDFAWDVTEDGKRFLLAAPQGELTGTVPFTVVLNWPTLLKKN
jgi:serine/threonine-protein kinase